MERRANGYYCTLCEKECRFLHDQTVCPMGGYRQIFKKLGADQPLGWEGAELFVYKPRKRQAHNCLPYQNKRARSQQIARSLGAKLNKALGLSKKPINYGNLGKAILASYKRDRERAKKLLEAYKRKLSLGRAPMGSKNSEKEDAYILFLLEHMGDSEPDPESRSITPPPSLPSPPPSADSLLHKERHNNEQEMEPDSSDTESEWEDA